jgi:hypothetical protein
MHPGSPNEQILLEDLIVESLKHKGIMFYYIPRTLVGKDEILGEDRLSEFKSSYAIEAYFENVNSYEGAGFMIQKFGLMIEQSATIIIARRRWEQLVGQYGQTIIPTRPNEGDLIYFPLTDSMFEIMFVEHQNPFYQLGKVYVYKLNIELFRYASEKINTGIPEIDVFESLKSHDMLVNQSSDTPQSYGDNDKFMDEAIDSVFDGDNLFGNLIKTPFVPPEI